MPTFDRINGLFVAKCTFEERNIFKRNGWTFRTVGKNAKGQPVERWATDDVEKARNLYQYAVGRAKEHIATADAVRQAAVEASWADDSDTVIPSPEGLTYLPFQRAGIEYASQRSHVLIADPPGLGKTIQAIGVHNMNRTGSVLIICPASIKVNWFREWLRWDYHGMSVDIATSKSRTKQENGIKDSWTEYHFPDTNVVIVNYDMLDTFDDQIKSRSWDLLICDEAHLLKSQTTVRYKCVFGGRRKATHGTHPETGKKVVKKKAKTYRPIIAQRSLYLTGTPILSKPVELWSMVSACDPLGLGKSWDRYVDRYCDAYPGDFGLDVSGASNIEELNRLLRERFMVRRDKRAVLKELPDKRRELIVLPHDKLEKPLRKERSIVEKAMAAFERDVLGLDDTDPDFYYIAAIEGLTDKIAGALDAQDSEELDWNKAISSLSEPDQIMFAELSLAREEVARAKVGMVVEHVQKLLECEEPVILFAHHKSVISDLGSRLRADGVKVGEVTGSVPSHKRQDIVDAFQDGATDVIIGNITAMGVGFTLTRSSHVVFAELDWVPAMIEQAEDRAWRHGQKNAVLIQHIVVDGSIEARMAQSIVAKMEIIHAALDAKAA